MPWLDGNHNFTRKFGDVSKQEGLPSENKHKIKDSSNIQSCKEYPDPFCGPAFQSVAPTSLYIAGAAHFQVFFLHSYALLSRKLRAYYEKIVLGWLYWCYRILDEGFHQSSPEIMHNQLKRKRAQIRLNHPSQCYWIYHLMQKQTISGLLFP